MELESILVIKMIIPFFSKTGQKDFQNILGVIFCLSFFRHFVCGWDCRTPGNIVKDQCVWVSYGVKG